MTDTQWPTLPMPDDALSEDATIQDSAAPEGAARFTVLIEENQGSGDSIRWVGVPSEREWPSRREAQAAAADYAWRYVPRHPMSEQGRSVYRISLDQYLTVVAGAMSNFSYRVSVAERL